MDAKDRYSTDRRSRERLRGLRTAAIELRANPNTLERDRIVGRLMSLSGVEDASWDDADAPSLVIQYDAELVSGAELVNVLYLCALPEQVRAGRQ